MFPDDLHIRLLIEQCMATKCLEPQLAKYIVTIVYDYARQSGFNNDKSRDISHDVLLHLADNNFKKLSSFNPDHQHQNAIPNDNNRFVAWLRRVTHNFNCDRVRNEYFKNKTFGVFKQLTNHSLQPDILSKLTYKEILLVAREKLTKTQMRIFELMYSNDGRIKNGNAEIAKKMGMKIETLYKHKSNIKNIFTKIIKIQL